jgi:Effector Associated Constant Component 1
VQVLLRVYGASGDDAERELASLEEWLRQERALKGAVARERRAPRPDEMGAVSDVLVAALGNGGAITALAASLGTWLVTRRSRVTVKVTGPDQTSVELDVRSTDAEALLRSVLREPGDGPAT